MDTSFWIQCNPKITIEYTTKKYFGRYLHRLVVYAPGGRSILSKNGIEQDIINRRHLTDTIGRYYPGMWGYYRNGIDRLDNVDFDLLEILKQIKIDTKSTTRVRIEEPMVQIYAESDEMLKHLVNTYFGGKELTIESVSGPRDSNAVEILNSGAIIRKTDGGYRHKVILHDGRYGLETKYALYNYLVGLGEKMVRVPAGTVRNMTSTSSFMWNCYYYTNDLSVNSFVGLIAPGAISICHELVVLPDK